MRGLRQTIMWGAKTVGTPMIRVVLLNKKVVRSPLARSQFLVATSLQPLVLPPRLQRRDIFAVRNHLQTVRSHRVRLAARHHRAMLVLFAYDHLLMHSAMP